MAFEVYSKTPEKELSRRKKENFEKYSRLIRWGRKYPVEFAHRIMGIDLLDYQKFQIYNSWFAEFICWLVCRNGAKTTDMAIYTMLRSLLIPYHATYFLGNVGEQSKEVYTKIEKIAKREISSFVGLTEVFEQEMEQAKGKDDGFIHNPASFTFQLFNGSSVNTLNSDITNIKGKRADLVCFDEAGWMSDELFVQAENFANQSSDFKLGGGVDLRLEPKAFPKQLLYASSASDRTSEFFKKFKSISQQMLMGDTRYWACNFDIDLVKNATFNGDPYPPLISEDKIEAAMRDNRDKALRELYNRFSADSYEGQIVTRRDIRAVTENKPPLLYNDTGDRRFLIAWDSARINDNSIIGVAELWESPDTGLNMTVQNVISLVDVSTKNKTPMRLPEQQEKFKEILLTYNGSEKGALDYENIAQVVCDAGAAGQIIGGVTDYLLDNWVDKHGNKHYGLIDRAHKTSETARGKFPDAIDIVRLVEPRAHRNEIFESLGRMIKQGLVHFPADSSEKDYIEFVNDKGEEEKIQLTYDEQMAMNQIDLMKTEAVTMCKYTHGEVTNYDFPPEKRNKMHDDRAFVLGLLCFAFGKIRRGSFVERKEETVYSDDDLCVTALNYN